MRLRALAALLALLATPAPAQTVAEQAARASADLQAAVGALQEAQTARDRVAALTQTIRAYEDGLAALREALRQAHLRETALEMQFQAKSAEIAQLLGVLMQVEERPGPLLLLHPSGPSGTVRAAMMLADVTPALQAEAERLRGELVELRDLRALQEAAGQTLGAGLSAAQEARTALSQAISDRTDLPRRYSDDPETLRRLLENADTIEAFTAGLTPDDYQPQEFVTARGSLPLPTQGNVVLRPGETDATGVTRPGVMLATRPRALVTAPWPATIRYRGPLLDYGNVIVMEPGGGYLLIIAGLETVYGELGEVVAAGAPLGLMGGAAAEQSVMQEGSGLEATETLYMELRQGSEPVDPTDWFATLKDMD